MDQQVATKADLEAVVTRLEASIEAAVTRARRESKADIDDAVTRLRQETKSGFESVLHLIEQLTERFDQRFEGMGSRMDRVSDTVNSIYGQMGALSRWGDRMDRNHLGILGTQAAQQTAIDSLAARVTRLEQERSQN